MSSEVRKANLSIKMTVCLHTLRNLLKQIKAIESDTQAPINDRLLQIKKIQDELSKVGMEIDSIKKEIKLIRTCSLN
jgi:hypothetical protein